MKTILAFALGVTIGYFVKSETFKSLIAKVKTWWKNR